MRASKLGSRAWVPAVLVLSVLAGLAGFTARAMAEAPYFYDEIASTATYDPEFDPGARMNRTLSVMAQLWSMPDAEDPCEGVVDQDYTQQYRAQWTFTLDQQSALSVELKGSSKGRVVDDDYFMKAEYLFKGAKAPLWFYGGMRLPRETDFLVYGGVETMSYRLSDILQDMARDVPVAYKGYAELRYDLDDEDPTLRLMVLGHTIPDGLLQRLTLAAGINSAFRDGMAPRWTLQGHAEYQFTRGFGQLNGVVGYAVDLEEEGEQRLSLGVLAGLF